jgi:hypothetical protein
MERGICGLGREMGTRWVGEETALSQALFWFG